MRATYRQSSLSFFKQILFLMPSIFKSFQKLHVATTFNVIFFKCAFSSPFCIASLVTLPIVVYVLFFFFKCIVFLCLLFFMCGCYIHAPTLIILFSKTQFFFCLLH
ncbi:hypothetical protein M758_9G047100 [Ceratodon purpureus]|nr:hypothetical protein M758_9G047100 [Ceratodon purpureus]